MSKGSTFAFNRISLSGGCKNYENWTRMDKITNFLSNFVQYFESQIFITLLFIKSYEMSSSKARTFTYKVNS